MAAPITTLDTTTPFGVRHAGFLAHLAWRLSTTRWLPSGMRKMMRKKLGYRYPGPFDVNVKGLQFRVYPAENYCDRNLIGRNRLPEPDERNLVEQHIRHGMVFVDVGANVGTYALDVARKAGEGANILAFEPHPRTFAKLSFNRKACGADNVKLFNLGIGSHPGSMTLWSDGGGNIGHASLLPEGAGRAVTSVNVEIVPLVQILEQHGITHIDLLKIDIEGYESHALLPLFKDAKQGLWPAAILLEVVHRHLWHEDCITSLQQFGYAIGDETEENVLLIRQDHDKLAGS